MNIDQINAYIEAVACNFTRLSKKIRTLRSDTEIYKTQVATVAGVCIAVIVTLILLSIYFYIYLRKINKNYQQKLNEMDPLRNHKIVSGEQKPEKPAEPIRNRFKPTTGNFDGLSPTDLTHFDYPSNGINMPEDAREPKTPKTPRYGRW